MPAFSLSPSGAGNYTQWVLVLGSSNWSAMAAFDGLGEYLRADPVLTDTYTLSNLPADAETISGAVSHNLSLADALSAGGLNVDHLIRSGGSDTSYGVSTITPADGTFYTFSKSMATAPGGGAWTVSTINGMEAGMSSPGTSRVLATGLSITGTYLQSGSYFISIYNLIPPLMVGASLLHRDFVRMVDYSARWVGGTRVVHSPAEVASAWRDYKSGVITHPLYFDLGGVPRVT